MPFQISGTCRGLLMKVTRVRASSAAVLAMNWMGDGCTDIQIIDNAGRSYDLAAFRSAMSRQASPNRPF